MKTLSTVPLFLLTLVVVKVAASSLDDGVSCTAGHVIVGENAVITCHFSKSIFNQPTVYIRYYPLDAPESAKGEEILCNVTKLLHGTCREKGRYVFRTNSKHELTVEILGITKHDAGRYMCQFIPPDEGETKSCRLEVNEPESPTLGSAREPQPTQSARDNSLSEPSSGDGATPVLTIATMSVLGVFILAVVIVFIYTRYKKRRKLMTCYDPNKRHNENDHTPAEVAPFTDTTRVEICSGNAAPPATKDSTPEPHRHNENDHNLSEVAPSTITTQVEICSGNAAPPVTKDSTTEPHRHNENDRKLSEVAPSTSTTQVEICSGNAAPPATKDSTPEPQRTATTPSRPTEEREYAATQIKKKELSYLVIDSQSYSPSFNSQYIEQILLSTDEQEIDWKKKYKNKLEELLYVTSLKSVREMQLASAQLKLNIMTNYENPLKTELLNMVSHVTDKVERM